MKYRMLLGTVVLIQSYASQHCNEFIDKNTATEQFIFKRGGEWVVDKKTGITWHRCLVGQRFNNHGSTTIYIDDKCDGKATPFSRNEALTYLENTPNVRLPNIKELASIAEMQCVNPAINLQVFPNQGNQWIWSATPLSSAANPPTALSVNFSTGIVGINGSENSLIRFIAK